MKVTVNNVRFDPTDILFVEDGTRNHTAYCNVHFAHSVRGENKIIFPMSEKEFRTQVSKQVK